MSGNRTPEKKLSLSEESPNKPVFSPAAVLSVITAHLAQPSEPPYDPNPAPQQSEPDNNDKSSNGTVSAQQNDTKTANSEVTPTTPQTNHPDITQQSVSDGSKAVETKFRTENHSDDGSEDGWEPVKDRSRPPMYIPQTPAHRFEVSPLEHAPGQNAFDAPDRPYSPEEAVVAETRIQTVKDAESVNRTPRTPQRSISPGGAHVFEVSPLEHAPGQNVFGTPDRLHSPDEEAARASAALALTHENKRDNVTPNVGEPGPAVDEKEPKVEAGDVEKRPALRSPEEKQGTKKTKEGVD